LRERRVGRERGDDEGEEREAHECADVNIAAPRSRR
jgi:hypothetical protein